MTNEQLKKLENDLWASANSLRAYGGIKAADYAVPVITVIYRKQKQIGMKTSIKLSVCSDAASGILNNYASLTDSILSFTKS